MSYIEHWGRNRILSALPPTDREVLQSAFTLVPLSQGQVIYEAGDAASYVYFPTDCIVSLMQMMENGACAEIAVVGNDGMVGVTSFLGGGGMPNRAIVRSAGHAYRMRAHLLKEQFSRGGPLQMALLRYTQTLLMQMSQTALCYRHHSVDQQLCRWLLISLDRLSSNTMAITQELIANMIGVRREGVCEASRKLQTAGLINYRRGKITVVDRSKLERQVCECYGVVRKASDRLGMLPSAPAPMMASAR